MEGVADQAAGLPAVIDEERGGRAARQGLEGERPVPRTGRARARPRRRRRRRGPAVEQGLAQAVGGRADAPANTSLLGRRAGARATRRRRFLTPSQPRRASGAAARRTPTAPRAAGLAAGGGHRRRAAGPRAARLETATRTGTAAAGLEATTWAPSRASPWRAPPLKPGLPPPPAGRPAPLKPRRCARADPRIGCPRDFLATLAARGASRTLPVARALGPGPVARGDAALGCGPVEGPLAAGCTSREHPHYAHGTDGPRPGARAAGRGARAPSVVAAAGTGIARGAPGAARPSGRRRDPDRSRGRAPGDLAPAADPDARRLFIVVAEADATMRLGGRGLRRSLEPLDQDATLADRRRNGADALATRSAAAARAALGSPPRRGTFAARGRSSSSARQTVGEAARCGLAGRRHPRRGGGTGRIARRTGAALRAAGRGARNPARGRGLPLPLSLGGLLRELPNGAIASRTGLSKSTPASSASVLPSASLSTLVRISSTSPTSRSPSWNGPNESRISRFTDRPRCSRMRLTSRFLPSRRRA